MIDMRSILNRKTILIYLKNNQSGNVVGGKNPILNNNKNHKLHRNKLYKHCVNLLQIK